MTVSISQSPICFIKDFPLMGLGTLHGDFDSCDGALKGFYSILTTGIKTLLEEM